MQFEISQRFYFEAAHTLDRPAVDVEQRNGSRRVHGHTYQAEVRVAGQPDPQTGMVVDLAQLRAGIERLRDMLDHHLLDEVPGLGPPTLENLCRYIAGALAAGGLTPCAVRVWREASGDGCQLTL